MIETYRKDKLAHWLSYPIGAEAINAALVEVPAANLIRLWFYGHQSADEQEKLRSNEACRILEIYHSTTSAYWGEFWSLTVYAVASQNRPVAKKLLLEQVLPKLRAWLSEDRTEVWLQEQHGLKFDFDPLDKQIIVTGH